jgi:hypothetical protein
LRACINSILADDPGGMEVIVVDNASSDESPQMVRDEFPAVQVIANTENYGFGKACNQGMKVARGEFVVLINPDSEVRKGAFTALLEYGRANPDIGIFGLKVLNCDGSLQYSCRHFPTLQAGIFRNTILGHFFPQNTYLTDYLMTTWDHGEPRDVDWVSGCAMVLRREFIDRVGGFDERFFMYCEDVDLGYRAHENGWRVTYFPYAVVVHARAKSSDKNANPMIIEFHKSMYYFFKKHYLKNTSLFVRAIVPIGLIARAGFFVLRNDFYATRNAVRAMFRR